MTDTTRLAHRSSAFSVMSGKSHPVVVKNSMMESHIRSVFAKTSGTSIRVTTSRDDQPEKPPKSETHSNFFKSPKKRKLKVTQIENFKSELTDCCLTHVQDSYRVHLNRLRGLEILEALATRASISKINSEMVVHMVWSSLSCIHHFLLRLKSHGGMLQWLRRRQARKSIKVYDKLLAFLEPTYYTVVFNAIITFYEEANLWEIKYFCSNILQRLLLKTRKYQYESIHEILFLIENSTLTNSMASRQILLTLFDIEDGLQWSIMNERIIGQFLDMYYKSITPENREYNYEPLEKGLETCIRAMTEYFPENQLMFMIKWMLEITVLEDIPDENLLNFGSLLEHITMMYSVRACKRPLPEQVFPLTLKLIASNNLLYSLLGNRVLHNMIDRCKNKLKFDAPRIFFRTAHYNIVLNKYNTTDKLFFQRYRSSFHKTFVASVIKHGIHKIHLENIYVSIVLFLVEVPCGYTAAAAVCLAMAIQEAALESKSIEMTHAHRLHATVVSIMSLVCYIHTADVFYEYVNMIIERRANQAPHLNPPLKMNYKYAQHHILWNKSDLFFEDWEARYGLWRCFKNKHKEVVVARI